MMKINLDELEIFGAAEASELWGKSSNYVRQTYAKYPDRFPPGSIRKVGRDLIVTREAMKAVTGIAQTIEELEIKAYDKWIGTITKNCDVSYNFLDQLNKDFGIKFSLNQFKFGVLKKSKRAEFETSAGNTLVIEYCKPEDKNFLFNLNSLEYIKKD